MVDGSLTTYARTDTLYPSVSSQHIAEDDNGDTHTRADHDEHRHHVPLGQIRPRPHWTPFRGVVEAAADGPEGGGIVVSRPADLENLGAAA